MRNFLFYVVSLSFISSIALAQQTEDIELLSPNKTGGKSIMEAIAERKSVRSFDSKDLSPQQLSDLLWAANGVSRPDGKLTAPSAMNKQDITLYALTKKGVYLYDAQSHSLKGLVDGDHREKVSNGNNDAPIIIVLVSDISKFGRNDDFSKMLGAMDAGFVGQNIYLYCSGNGLATVTRASFNKDALTELLNLSETQILMLNHPVGYPKN
jgi:Nitroreductase